MKELRVKSEYIHNKEVMGSVGCKIFALNLEEALAGSPLHVYNSEKEADDLCQEIKNDCLSFLSEDMFNKDGRGVLCVASSLGSLEAIMSYLQEEKIPVAGVNLGYVQKKDVIKILTIHNKEKDKKKEILKEDLCILAFDVHINKDAQEYADKNGVTILTADIIYHLKDKYRELEDKCFEERKKEKMKEAIFPCRLKIIPKAIFNRIDPVIVGVNITDGILKKDTPIYCVEKKKVLGVIESIQKEKKELPEAFKNNDVSIRIKTIDKHVGFKTHFDEGDTLIANLSRQSIDRLKEYFYDDLVKNPDWITLIKEIKETLEIGK
jgi:translation initiation factor 5B